MAKNNGQIKKLVKPLRRKAGRGASGRITVRHKGGGHKKMYRLVDFKREKLNIPAKVERIEYDPNRNCHIALILYADGERRYILAPHGLLEGAKVVSSEMVPVEIGNRLKIKHIPVGTFIHDIEMNPGQGGKMVRGAGSAAQVLATEGKYAHVKLPSSEVRMILAECMATIGAVSRPEYKDIIIGKAGRSRWMGIRPAVRGSAMAVHDHPHGGGEGRAPIGLRKGPKTPWGKPARGVKTRKRKKPSNKFILSRRKRR